MYVRAWLDTPLCCRDISNLSKGAVPLMGSLRNSVSDRLIRKQSVSVVVEEAHIWFEALKKLKIVLLILYP